MLYGTTLNATVITKKFVFVIGIGDGDVVAVNGKRVEWLLPSHQQYSTSTPSLCKRFDVIMECFNAQLIPINGGKKLTDSRFMPELVMLATDGLRNSFTCDEAFADKILDIAYAFKKGEGGKFVKASKKWIEERSQQGLTQDDISFCLYTKYSGDAKTTKKQG